MRETIEQNRANWRKHVEMLRTMDCSEVNPNRLAEVEDAIRRCPNNSVSDAVMQINGGWICDREYDLCLAALLQADCLEPSGFGVFRIDRRKLPLIEVENKLADAITIHLVEQPVKTAKEPEPIQWGLF